MTSAPAASPRRSILLGWEVDNLQRDLDERFDPPANGERRTVSLSASAEYLIVRNFPLPDDYAPDHVDFVLLTDGFPAVPPIGLYLLNENAAPLIAQLNRKFNTFRDAAFHDAPPIDGFTWLCFSYAENRWRYRADAPARGDNIQKFLSTFYAQAAT